MSIATRQQLADFCLRQLGGGVVNIEVTDQQLEDAVDVAIEWYQEFHYDGVEKDYLVKKVAATVVTVADTTGLSVDETLTNETTGSYAKITALTGTTITIGQITGEEKFAVDDVLTNGTIDVTATAVALGEIDSKYFTMDEHVVGVTRILPLATQFTPTDILFNPQYQLMLQEINNITSSGGISYYYSVFNYLAHLEFILRKEKDYRFNRRWGRIYLDISWGSDVKIGDYVAFEVYRALVPEDYPKMLNDRWLKEYTTALIKRQWGTNLQWTADLQRSGK
jgi:hypothetical protein